MTVPFWPRCRCDSWCRAAGSGSSWACRHDGHWEPLSEAESWWEEEGDSNSSRRKPILGSCWPRCAGRPWLGVWQRPSQRLQSGLSTAERRQGSVSTKESGSKWEQHKGCKPYLCRDSWCALQEVSCTLYRATNISLSFFFFFFWGTGGEIKMTSASLLLSSILFWELPNHFKPTNTTSRPS